MKIFIISLLSFSVCLSSLEQEYTEDTARCVQTAKAKHLHNPSAGLDHFLLAQLQAIPEDNDSELKEVKTTLKDFEKLDYDKLVHNLVKRDTEEESSDEARGWKNKDKKKKKKKKKQRLEELLDNPEPEDDDGNPEADPEVSKVSKGNDDEDVDDEDESESPSDKNVVQFSVYSAQPRPQYSPPQSDKKKYLFSVDYQGNAHYIDEEEVSALLRNPQAMKAMMSYLGNSPDKVGSQTRPDGGYRVVPETETRLYRPPPPPPPQRKVYNRLTPPRGPPPRLEFFGPKDFKPESAFLIPQSKIRPTMLSTQERAGGEVKGPVREKLEPKPRKLVKRSDNSQMEEQQQPRTGVVHLFREMQAPRTHATKRTSAPRKSKSNRRKKQRKSPNADRCKKCENPKIAQKSPSMCKKCPKQKVDCKRCKNERYRKSHSDCKSCVQTTTTTTRPTTTDTTSTTTTAPLERSLIQEKKKCRRKAYKRNNMELCKKALDKCNSRMFRTTHRNECLLRDGDTEWLTQKCVTKVFVNKNRELCQTLRKSVSVQDDSFNSLEDIVTKCKESSYKEDNKEKCKVVEALEAATDDINKNKQDEVEEMSPNRVVEDSFNRVDDLLSKCKQSAFKEENQEKCKVVEAGADDGEDISPVKVMEDYTIDHPSKQKADIVESIKKKTTPSKNKGKKKNNKQKKQKKKDEKKKEVEKKEDKKKDKTKEKKEKKEKSKCNKPKYASTHPEECKSMKRMENIFVEKCKKEKYRLKHSARCKVVKDSGGEENLTDVVLDRLMDVRCRKEAFRASYPELCTLDQFDDNVLETTTINPAWVRERCKHDKFKERNVELCNKIKDYELDIDNPESLIDNVINDIKNIVSNEKIPPIVDNPLQETTTSTAKIITTTTEVQKIENETTPPSTTPTTTESL